MKQIHLTVIRSGDSRSNVTCTVLLRRSEVASHFTTICGASSRAKRCCLPWRDSNWSSKDTNRLRLPPQWKDSHARTHAQNGYFIFSEKMTFNACHLDGSVLSLSHSCSLTPAGRLSLLRRYEFSIGRIQSNRQQVYQQSNEYSSVFACEVQIGLCRLFILF